LGINQLQHNLKRQVRFFDTFWEFLTQLPETWREIVELLQKHYSTVDFEAGIANTATHLSA